MPDVIPGLTSDHAAVLRAIVAGVEAGSGPPSAAALASAIGRDSAIVRAVVSALRAKGLLEPLGPPYPLPAALGLPGLRSPARAPRPPRVRPGLPESDVLRAVAEQIAAGGATTAVAVARRLGCTVRAARAARRRLLATGQWPSQARPERPPRKVRTPTPPDSEFRRVALELLDGGEWPRAAEVRRRLGATWEATWAARGRLVDAGQWPADPVIPPGHWWHEERRRRTIRAEKLASAEARNPPRNRAAATYRNRQTVRAAFLHAGSPVATGRQ